MEREVPLQHSMGFSEIASTISTIFSAMKADYAAVGIENW
jgi:hypothetical protein